MGYFTSQWFGNFYLKELDHYIKQKLGAVHYMRYMDDMVILGKSKKKLHAMQREITSYLWKGLKLELKGDWQVFRFEYVAKDGTVCGRMLDFMGFQFHRDRITMRKSTIQRARAKAFRIKAKEKITWYDAAVMLSYMGWFQHTDTYDYYLKYIKPNVNVNLRKNIRQVEQKEAEDSGETVSVWQYEEQELTVQEYESMILMRQVVSENASGIVESVTQFQRDVVIDEYTEQLIEEGLI